MDATFDRDINNNSTLTDREDEIKRNIHTLFKMKPGDDEYNLKKGIDILSMNYKSISDQESMKSVIEENINTYSDYEYIEADFYQKDKTTTLIGLSITTDRGVYLSLVTPSEDNKSLSVLVKKNEEG